MSHFPFYVNVASLHGVIIGGGKMALEKVERLVSFQAKITLIAPRVCDEIKAYADRLTFLERTYRKEDLVNAEYVIAATNLRGLNEQIRRDAKERGLLINVVDMPEMCDFIFPSVVQRGRLVVGVSTSGAGPQVAIRLRKEIEQIIPDEIEETLDYLAKERIRAKEEMSDPVVRRNYLIELANTLLNDENRKTNQS